MATNRSQNPTPLSREKIAKLEIGRTEIAPWLARTMTVAFLALIFAVPLSHELVDADQADGNQAFQQQGRQAEKPDLPSSTWPRCASIFTTLPEVASVFDRADGDLWQRTLAANRRLLKNIDVYEASLKDESRLVERLLGPTQHGLAKWGGLGNEKAYLGRGGWLFYRPGVDYVTGPGFLDPRRLARRAQSGKPYAAPIQPDPRPAIIQFAKALDRRGIALVIVPAPGKATIHPERLSARYSGTNEALQNESFGHFRQELEGEGVIVFDPAPLLQDRLARTGQPQYLTSDTHWTCQAAQAVAEALRELIDSRSLLPPRPPTKYGSRMATVSNLGDIAAMLRLRDEQTLFPPETVEVRQVLDAAGKPWQPDPTADILLLGDSFTNIYSQPNMNWGDSAGLAEQLSFAMRRPIDRISQNDSGAFATRQTLAQQLARGDDPLAGKRLVIWEFAARELAAGDWKFIPLLDPATKKTASPAPALADATPIVVRGRVESTAGVPKPGSVPYRDAVTSLHLTGVEAIDGVPPGEQIVVYMLGMRENRWTAAARYQPGDTVTLRLQPWETVTARYGSLTRIELDDPDFTLIDLPLFWAETSDWPP